MKDFLPVQAHPFLAAITIGLQIALILFVALLLRSVLHRLIGRVGEDKQLPLEFVVGGRRVVTFLLLSTALLLVLDRVGISGTVIWTGFTGFVAVGAVAFFAAWSVLSNIFCAVLIFTSRPFGLHDRIEILENGDKPGLGGEVMDINLIYTTLRENTAEGEEPSYLRVPNSLFFQRTTRLRTRAAAVRSLLG
ncbi:mechanosensitive ion channel family protein [Hydrogenophaga sp.]|uniref:mechanosensitive ion channel family protein n=1 Tax=Hydrogenophaga sp. TaxID=1904254 RepID=UPI0027261F2A|nr:mechanosensitive ion channel family protein [Hydrogenophaga sp.]MDO9436860.1 mechanosensitive ion channel family protein [Hydrogenophaga sp.]